MGRGWKDTAISGAEFVLEVAKGASEAFGPLKAALTIVSTVYDQYKVRQLPSTRDFLLTLTNLQETAAVKDKIEVLRSRITKLEKVFKEPSVDEEERGRRKELLLFVIYLHWN